MINNNLTHLLQMNVEYGDAETTGLSIPFSQWLHICFLNAQTQVVTNIRSAMEWHRLPGMEALIINGYPLPALVGENSLYNGIHQVIEYIDQDFEQVVHEILSMKGRLVITGVGKSAIIANKIVATLNSTGTPAIFMHAADAIHGDMGMIREEDMVMCISKSGNTEEIKVLLPLLKRTGAKIIGLVSNEDCYVAKHADYVLKTPLYVFSCFLYIFLGFPICFLRCS